MLFKNFCRAFGFVLPLWLVGGFGLNCLNHTHRSNAEIVEMSILYALIMAGNWIFFIRQAQRREQMTRDESSHPR